MWRHDAVNRGYIDSEDKQPQTITFNLGLEFIETNKREDNWFVQIETFDPHEPFYTMERYKTYGNCARDYNGPIFDWPHYRHVTDEERPFMDQPKREYASLVTMCDVNLGKVLDIMDANGMWDDTILIVCTDHGFMLGEHGLWAKCHQPFYEEISHTPLFMHDPRCRRSGRAQALVQTIDIAPTLLDFFGVLIPPDMQGKPLRDVTASDAPARDALLFGIHGGHVNCTDGRYVYMIAPNPDAPLHDYTLMPTHMRGRFRPEELSSMTLSEPFPFTKGCPVMRIAAKPIMQCRDNVTMLFDLESDPMQLASIFDHGVEMRMRSHILRLMRENNAPEESYIRFGLY